MVMFAGNSLLCRAALLGERIDPIGYTGLRLASAALVLLPWALRARRSGTRVDPLGAGSLLLYAFAFSYAYLSLNTGTGALLLFGSVQVFMLLAGLWRGDRPSPRQWGGLVLALVGLVVLVAPGLNAPTPGAAALMTVAGLGWALYTLCGRQSARPAESTALNFLVLLPVAGLALFAAGTGGWTREGVLLAILSGAISSGVGYVLWYASLPSLSRSAAAIVQLTVPVLAALFGVLFLSEDLTGRLVGAAAITLGGIALALAPGRAARPGSV